MVHHAQLHSDTIKTFFSAHPNNLVNMKLWWFYKIVKFNILIKPKAFLVGYSLSQINFLIRVLKL